MLLCDEARCRLLMIANSYHEPISTSSCPEEGHRGAGGFSPIPAPGMIEPAESRYPSLHRPIRVEGRSLLLLGGEA